MADESDLGSVTEPANNGLPVGFDRRELFQWLGLSGFLGAAIGLGGARVLGLNNTKYLAAYREAAWSALSRLLTESQSNQKLQVALLATITSVWYAATNDYITIDTELIDVADSDRARKRVRRSLNNALGFGLDLERMVTTSQLPTDYISAMVDQVSAQTKRIEDYLRISNVPAPRRERYSGPRTST